MPSSKKANDLYAEVKEQLNDSRRNYESYKTLEAYNGLIKMHHACEKLVAEMAELLQPAQGTKNKIPPLKHKTAHEKDTRGSASDNKVDEELAKLSRKVDILLQEKDARNPNQENAQGSKGTHGLPDDWSLRLACGDMTPLKYINPDEVGLRFPHSQKLRSKDSASSSEEPKTTLARSGIVREIYEKLKKKVSALIGTSSREELEQFTEMAMSEQLEGMAFDHSTLIHKEQLREQLELRPTGFVANTDRITGKKQPTKTKMKAQEVVKTPGGKALGPGIWIQAPEDGAWHNEAEREEDPPQHFPEDEDCPWEDDPPSFPCRYEM
eukprot:g10579.t1